jgi:hypothetical protein
MRAGLMLAPPALPSFSEALPPAAALAAAAAGAFFFFSSASLRFFSLISLQGPVGQRESIGRGKEDRASNVTMDHTNLGQALGSDLTGEWIITW